MNHNLTAEEKIKRDDRVRYYVLKLKDVMSKAKLFETIEKNKVTSKSTAERVSKGVFDWKEGEIELFLATYNPVKSDSKAIDDVLGMNASKVSNEVKEEAINNNELKDGEIINHDGKKYKFVYTGSCISEDCNKCAFCDIEENLCICNNEIPIDNVNGYFVEVIEEDKCTDCKTESLIIGKLTTENKKLQKGIEELNEDITQSKIIINEVCKERDDKAEEIRVLSLELQKYKNHWFEQELKLIEKENAVELNLKYDSLYKVLLMAYNQASDGKGKERHQLNDEEPFENQKICEIARRLSIDYNLGQAVKKIYESKRLVDGRDIAELYGAINYIAAAIIVKQEKKQNE